MAPPPAAASVRGSDIQPAGALCHVVAQHGAVQRVDGPLVPPGVVAVPVSLRRGRGPVEHAVIPHEHPPHGGLLVGELRLALEQPLCLGLRLDPQGVRQVRPHHVRAVLAVLGHHLQPQRELGLRLHLAHLPPRLGRPDGDLRVLLRLQTDGLVPALVAELHQARRLQLCLHLRREVAERRLHPPAEAVLPLGADLEAPVQEPRDVPAGDGQPRRAVRAERGRHARRSRVQPQVQVGVDEPLGDAVHHAEGDLVGLAVDQEAQERGQLDVVGREVERAQRRHGLPEQRVDAARVDDRERHERAGEVAVHAHDDLAVRGVAPPSGEVVLADVDVRRVGVPELVVGVRGHEDFQDRAVGARRNGHDLGARVRRVLDAEPEAAAVARGLRYRQDQVRRLEVRLRQRRSRRLAIDGAGAGGESRVREVRRGAMELEGDADVVHAGVLVVDEVLEHDGEHAASWGTEERGVAGHVLADCPADAVGGRLSGGGAEELGAVEPDGGDAVVLVPGDGDGEGEHDERPGRGAPRGRRVRGRGGGGAVGVGEGVGEHGHDAGRRQRRRPRGRVGGVEVLPRGRITEPAAGARARARRGVAVGDVGESGNEEEQYKVEEERRRA
uniref:Uncharacterized protein n=1 Tax=Setaria italica TaxID=4555 RepID=K3Z4N4_SETIT